MKRRIAMATCALLLTACPPATPPVDPGTLQFWSLVKITSSESTFAFKCLHEQTGDSLSVACFSPVEMPLFTVSIQENRVETEASSPAVLSKMPFDISLIGRDVWRAQVALTDEDLRSYSELNEPGLEEDHIEVGLDAEGRILTKTFLADGETVATVQFSQYPQGEGHAGRLELVNLHPHYVIEIVQGQ